MNKDLEIHKLEIIVSGQMREINHLREKVRGLQEIIKKMANSKLSNLVHEVEVFTSFDGAFCRAVGIVDPKIEK